MHPDAIGKRMAKVCPLFLQLLPLQNGFVAEFKLSVVMKEGYGSQTLNKLSLGLSLP